jgi:cellulose biosynthesis protein BcsQ
LTAKVIAIANQKCGVGKKTTCVNLGIRLAREAICTSCRWLISILR